MIDIIFFCHTYQHPLLSFQKVWIEVKESYFQFYEDDFESYPSLLQSLSFVGLNFKRVGIPDSNMFILQGDESLFLKLKINNYLEMSIELII